MSLKELSHQPQVHAHIKLLWEENYLTLACLATELVHDCCVLAGTEQVSEVKGDDVVCVIKNSATLAGSLFTLHASQIRIDLPTLSDKDKEVSHASNLFSLKIDVV